MLLLIFYGLLICLKYITFMNVRKYPISKFDV